jgi:hypothetical protein
MLRLLLANLCAGLVLTGAVAAFDPLSTALRPHPSMTPRDVVQIQLEAMRRSPADDRGIAVAFRFASPGNKRVTGPLERFARMIRSGPYALMLAYQDVEYGPLQVREDRAAQAVTLVGSYESVTYVFLLSRQPADGEFADCWMTDAVSVMPGPGKPT